MKTEGTYLQNDNNRPIVYGEVEVSNTPRKRLKGEPEKEGILCRTVCAGFCGTDHELMHMGQRGELGPKFPAGTKRLINGHEGVVYILSLRKFAVVLIRGGDSFDPTRYADDETYFEYGCDKADGLMARENYFHPDMLIPVPEKLVRNGKIPLSLAKRLSFADPYACMIFQLERIEDLGAAHNFRVEMARYKCSEEDARESARINIFSRTVIFGLGTTGMFIGELIRERYPCAEIFFVSRSRTGSEKVRYAVGKARAGYIENCFDGDEGQLAAAIIDGIGGKATLFIGCSGTDMEHRIAFEHGVLGNNAIFDSFTLGPAAAFKTMPFGFKNQLIFGSINFRQEHMRKAITILSESDYDGMTGLVELDELKKDPVWLYRNRIFAKGAPAKSVAVWSPELVDAEN